jgi:hypothetical protein
MHSDTTPMRRSESRKVSLQTRSAWRLALIQKNPSVLRGPVNTGTPNRTSIFPLVEWGWTREDCSNYETELIVPPT